ncbi:MAG: hypothetical protein M3N19_09705 [Candidatus Eremiobacteraeota bacterium]|nr:hypothetical protein [Candidatus Eremiobacteraeota bacterium]
MGRKQPPSQYRAGNFQGIDAPWVLSALPECLIPVRVWRARTRKALLPHIPSAALHVSAGTTLQYRSCEVVVGANDAMVTRGDDRFHIPAKSQFFTVGQKQLLFLREGRAAELRMYTTSNL